MEQNGHLRMKGSLTVEAAFCVPVVLLALYLFLQMFVFLRIQTDMQAAMSRVARRLTEYGTVYSKLESLSAGEADDLLRKIGADVAIGRVASQTYLGYLLREEIRDADWIGWIRGGASGVSTSGSSMFEENGRLSLWVSYRFSAAGGLFSAGSIPVVQRLETGSFHGRDRVVETPEGEEGEEDEEEKVYVAANGAVYHRSATCTYLKPDIRQVAYAAIGAQRNADGEKYRQCRYCDHLETGETVFITSYGNRYHTVLSCSELRRTYRTMTVSEAEGRGLRPCSKCGKTKQDDAGS